MKEFDLEAAKAGAPICTRDGRAVRVTCFDRIHPKFPITGLMKDTCGNEYQSSYTADGRFFDSGSDNSKDLMMATVKKEGWINIYPKASSTLVRHDSKEIAISNARDTRIATVKVEWEE